MFSEHVTEKGNRLAAEGDVETIYLPDLIGGIVEGSDGMVHTPSIYFDGRRYCGCRGYWYSEDDVCSHIVATIESVVPEETRDRLYYGIRNGSPMTESQYVHTTLKPWNRMMSTDGDASGGGIPHRSPFALAGRYKAGKTILSYQLVFEALRNAGGNALIVDTESSLDTYQDWQPTFESRYGIDVNLTEIYPTVRGDDVSWGDYGTDPDADHQIFVMDVRSLEDILTIHGRPMRMDTSGGKMQIMPNGDFDRALDSPIGKFVRSKDIEMVVYDSISNPLEIFTNRQPDRPARAKATNWWLLPAQEIAQKERTMQVYVTHLTKNPSQQSDRPEILGGKAVGHQTKYQVYLREAHKNLRALKLFRHPSREPWTDTYWMDLRTGEGYVEADDNQIPNNR